MTRKNIIYFLQQHLWWMLLLFLVILQLPFLQADPDLYLSHSRDAHSDEGLNSIQLRNYINHGYLDPWECDNLVKNPLYNLFLFLPFKIFGTFLLTGRLSILLFVIIALCFIGRDKTFRPWLTILIPVVYVQYYVFQYSHFVLAEMMAISMIVLGIYTAVKWYTSTGFRQKIKWMLLTLLALNMSWFFKIQFLYMLGFVFLLVCIGLIKEIKGQKKMSGEVIKMGLTALVIQLLILSLYYFAWYHPLQAPFEYIMQNQAGNRFAPKQFFWRIVAENYRRYFTTQYIQPVWIVFMVALPVSVIQLFSLKDKKFRWIILLSFLWVVAELHKMAIQHVPSRYLLSGYAAMLVFITTVIYGGWLMYTTYPAGIKKWAGAAVLLLLVAISIHHVYLYSQVLGRRTYRIKAMNTYFASVEQPGMTVIGPWAPAATWNTKIRALPVWKDFLNDKKIKDTFKPDAIITEPGEADSDGAFCADGFDIVNESDSVKMTWIGKWPIHIYWMKKE